MQAVGWSTANRDQSIAPDKGHSSDVTRCHGDGRTNLISIGHMGSPEAIEAALATGMAEGAIETWDRLEALLAES